MSAVAGETWADPHAPALPDGVRRVTERRAEGEPALSVVGDWAERFEWLVQGTTLAGPDADFGLFGAVPVGEAMARWRGLRERTGLPRAVHGRQVHGAEVRVHDEAAAGLYVTEGVDGHVTDRRGVLLTVATADCVPISVIDPDRRRVALLHGGWRGTAAGIVESGLAALGADPGTLLAHMGPAICGACYEVGPEVHEALGQPVPSENTPIDVRAVQAHQLVAAGVPRERISVSTHCTRCGDGFYSHRGGSSGRQLGVLGIR